LRARVKPGALLLESRSQAMTAVRMFFQQIMEFLHKCEYVAVALIALVMFWLANSSAAKGIRGR
jgi:hypothetical protein